MLGICIYACMPDAVLALDHCLCTRHLYFKETTVTHPHPKPRHATVWAGLALVCNDFSIKLHACACMQDFTTCAWVPMCDLSEHATGEACLVSLARNISPWGPVLLLALTNTASVLHCHSGYVDLAHCQLAFAAATTGSEAW